ncbi:hypothetical protein SODALDRAFT_220862 [Sodiomyces alkalinus F11]|uniref:Protein Zds1 C-terminal domain-containing protein n=1 Tax=Sodiomyces alkalinus (strain CBS 110278 / VKM F-3762 / F11) TaxID=1314773 RepID=A0A3N2PQ07_SODAK|nr:hypothetical protein SODALDRAFT_220862 [Sodiomyces alkalinus F11]ROT36510.1 hypothetical protein SODALDRAFT_220862 [Sodiomyces alkalinus F11]
MMTSSQPRGDVGGSFASRRGHGSQLSISDPSHHVTEAIGTLYGDEDDYSNDQRPLSFMPNSQPEQMHRHNPADSPNNEDPRDSRRALLRSNSDQSGIPSTTNGGGSSPQLKKAHTMPVGAPGHRGGGLFENGTMSPVSPAFSLRDVQADSSQFAITNIEHPNDIAQELSNLQALRRMSMDVGNNSDPDLLPFSGLSLTAIPSIAPSGGDDEADPSRLLWVPAAVHPELAPTEFKNFLENRVKTIRRRSGTGDSLLSPDGLDRSNSGGLKRKKSMLSRQIDNTGGRAADSYIDGAERLDSKRSSENSMGELSLEELVKDPTRAVQRLARETKQSPSTGSGSSADDAPILPMAPGMGLRRSTRTTYRKGGSMRSGERLSLGKRVSAARRSQTGSESPETAPPPGDAPPGHKLGRVQSEPISENFSRPNRSMRRAQLFAHPESHASLTGGEDLSLADVSDATSATGSVQDVLTTRASPASESKGPVPQKMDSPLREEEPSQPTETDEITRPYPQRSSSSTKTNQDMALRHMTPDELSVQANKRPAAVRSPHSSSSVPTLQQQQQLSQQLNHAAPQPQSLNDMASHPSPIPGSGATSTDSLTFIPTLPPEERKIEKKSKKDKDDDSSSVFSSKSSSGWSKWLKGSGEDKEKKRKEDEKKKSSKSLVEKAQDNVRLDVLQNSIESAVNKGRESLHLDRENVDAKPAEERKREGSRKSDPSKKEKEGGGLFSSLFGGSKRKSDKQTVSKKGHQPRVSEERPYRPLRPDVDYPWTRFPLLEERAIYRMAHIKLANPRRSLASQVLLSNFMYNYLAIVQAMHPQAQIPQSPQQRRLEEERRRREQEEQYLAQQQMQQETDQDALDDYNYEYHRV